MPADGPQPLDGQSESSGAGERRWKIGPYAMEAEGWPESWPSYADQYYWPASDAEAPLRVTLEEEGEGARGPTQVHVDKLDCRRTDDGAWRISSEGALDARFDPDECTLQLKVFAHLESPHLVLGNALRGSVSLALPLRFGGLMFHASSGIYRDRGLLFPGISTAGKTTLALGMEEATYMSDDISLVGDLAEAPRLLASPFFGIAGRKGGNRSAPLGAAAILVAKHPEETLIERLPRARAVTELMRHVICWSQDRELHAALLQRTLELVERVPVFAVQRFLGDSSDEVCRRVLEAVDEGAS